MKISLASAMLLSFAVFAEGKRGGDKEECSYETAADAKVDGEWIKGALMACCGFSEADWCAKELEWTGTCDEQVLEDGEKWNPAQKYTCCKVDENSVKPEWCMKDDDDKKEDTSSDEGESSGDEKEGGKKSRKMTFIDEMGEDWTKQHKKRFAKWRKNCDCRPLSDGTITTFKTCKNKNARSVMCPFGVTDGEFQHCNAEDVGAEPARVTCRAGFWNWSCKSRCPATTIQCEAMDSALKRVESAEDTIARAGWRDACWSGLETNNNS